MGPDRTTGRIRIGLLLFVVLLLGAASLLAYRYSTRSTRLNNDAVDLMNLGNYEKALEILDQALELDQKNVEAHVNRGISLAERHRYDEALGEFDKAIALAPENPLTHFNKGQMLWYLNRYLDAIAPIQKATELRPENPGAWLILGDCLYETYLDRYAADPAQAGKPTQAEAAYRTYLRLKPGGPDRHAVEGKLKILSQENQDDFRQVIEKHKDRLKTESPKKP